MNQQLSLEVLIIGSGFSGLGAGIALKEMGVNDFVILERANDHTSALDYVFARRT